MRVYFYDLSKEPQNLFHHFSPKYIISEYVEIYSDDGIFKITDNYDIIKAKITEGEIIKENKYIIDYSNISFNEIVHYIPFNNNKIHVKEHQYTSLNNDAKLFIRFFNESKQISDIYLELEQRVF